MSLHSSGRNRLEALLTYLSGQKVDVPMKPRNRLEHYLLYLCKLSESFPASPRNRLEYYLDHLCKHRGDGGGGDITLTTLNVSENGTKNAPAGTAYNKVNVSVPVPTLDTLTATDNGTFTPQSGHAYDKVVVNVPKGITPSGTLPITDNGTYDVTQYAAAEVNVQSGGGGISWELIADFTSGEDAEIVEVTIPDGKRNAALYRVHYKSAVGEYYPHNRINSSSSGYFHSGGNWPIDCDLYVANVPNSSTKSEIDGSTAPTCYALSCKQQSSALAVVPPLTSVGISAYDSNHPIHSGFNIKIWRLIEP